ncbi:phage major capsid protein, partial [Stigmatella aurantiaca]
MTREQISEMVKALGPEVARELINAAAKSAPGRVGTDRTTREGSVYASVANFGAFTKRRGLRSSSGLARGDRPEERAEVRKIVLKAHKGMVLTDISNDLLRTPGVGDAGVGEDIRATVADGLDDAGFNGDGTGAAPKGLFAQLDAAHAFASTGTTADAYLADVDKAVELPMTAHVRMGTAAWVIHPTRATALMQLKDTGIFIFRQEMLD